MKLYSYFRSSAAYRVRIALNLKNLPHDIAPVHLLRGGGEHVQPAFKAKNPQGLVPVLEDEGRLLTQSLAIIEYLEERHPEPRLLPQAPADRARVRALAQSIACEIHPINNLRVLRYLTDRLGVDEEAKNAWYRHWVAVGLEAFEALVREDRRTGRFCHGDAPGLADVCLVPQLFNARRFSCDLAPYPKLLEIEASCQALAAFQKAAPAAQPDSEPAK
jgi:maleylacetoacetate isomerase